MTVKEMREKRARLWNEAKSILDTAAAENREVTGEEGQNYDGLIGEVDELKVNIDRAEGHEARAREYDADPRGGDEPDPMRTDTRTKDERYEELFNSWLRGGPAALNTEERKELRSGFSAVEPGELRAQGVATDAGGGYLVPPGFRQTLVEAMKWFGSVRSVATVITTDSGTTLEWPTVNDTANVGAILAENTVVTEQDVVIGTATLGAYKYTSKLVRVSLELLQDSAFNLPTWLAGTLATRLGRITNTHYTTGTGSAQPLGIGTSPTAGVTAANGTSQVTAVTYDSLISLIYSIDPAYRNGNQAFMMNDATIAAIRKVRDDSGGAGLGRPLWEPSVQVGQPDSFLGYSIVPNNDMPVMAASAKSILFGDFRAGYVIRDVLGIQQLRLDERYADFLQVAFLAFLRTDATVQDAGAYKSFVNAAS